jgi:mRNA-degrading endonuclease YafQ of YafQ-DinJ toxin-antitoxin module
MKVLYHKTFGKTFRALSSDNQQRTLFAIEKFRKNNQDASLQIHPLHGKMLGKHSFSVTNKVRVIFKYENLRIVVLLAVGGHDQVY